MIDLAARRCWVFDLDGTLTRSVHDFDAIRAELGIPSGHTILEYIETLPERAAAAMHEQLQRIEADLVARTEAQPGSQALLEALVGRGCRLGILTRNSRSNALATLERLGMAACFEDAAVLGRDEARPKPDPDGIMQLLERWGATAEAGVMVGDFEFDLRAGRHAGVLTVHFDETGAFAWPEHTDHPVRRFEDLIALLP